MSSAQLWSRPWALTEITGKHRVDLAGGSLVLPTGRGGGLWVYVPSTVPVVVNGSKVGGESVAGFGHSSVPRSLLLLPLPLKRRTGVTVQVDGVETLIQWPELPDRPASTLSPQTDDERAAYALFTRAQTVWDRLQDVDSALGDPARLWEELRRRWTSDDRSEPQMDVIVHHAVALRQTLEELDRAPRRILRRTQRHLPIARVQELNRRSMAWLVRQPGQSLAERAGDRQRLLAVAREENYDTLENRVLRSYVELAQHVSIAYLDRNVSKKNSARARTVDAYRIRCKRLAHRLAARGVRLAEPGVQPNFVLQQNARYHKIWDAWHQLLLRDRVLDELWRWQTRSWEEFCALAVMVAIAGVPGAKLVASAPLSFLDEQKRGSWVVHDNPLGVFYLEAQSLVLEVRYRMKEPGVFRADFAAPIWISVARTDHVQDLPMSVAVWPIWDACGGLVRSEPDELKDILSLGRKAGIKAAVVIRPAQNADLAEYNSSHSVLALALGTQGHSLWAAVERLCLFFSSIAGDTVGP